MLKKRIIPCLDIKNGRTVKGVNFKNLIDAGDPVLLASKYAEQGADEIVLLDISATNENRSTLISIVEKVGAALDIPFAVGGGVSSLGTAYDLLNAGADKVCVNSAAIKNPDFITALANNFGSQSIVAAVDTKGNLDAAKVYSHGGRKATDLNTLGWVQRLDALGAGEILLTSMDHDGVKDGFDISMYRQVSELINIPIIASGGAGKKTHFKSLFETTNVTGALAASIFHFNEIPIPGLKKYLSEFKIPIR